MALMVAPAKVKVPATAFVPARPAAHLCNAYPELYPVEAPSLAAGLIHNAAAYPLMYGLRDHLRVIGCPCARSQRLTPCSTPGLSKGMTEP